jgi:carboxypeptidase C (cathepsin A)
MGRGGVRVILERYIQYVSMVSRTVFCILAGRDWQNTVRFWQSGSQTSQWLSGHCWVPAAAGGRPAGLPHCSMMGGSNSDRQTSVPSATVGEQQQQQLAQYARKLKVESAVASQHSIDIGGASVPYTATCGTQPVWNGDGDVIASLFYTFYQRTDIPDKSTRPLIFSFNGGPGSASLWMHIAFTGPVQLNISEEGYPLQPYGVKPNPHSILDVADILYIDPVNTGFSRILDPDTDREVFFGVNADIKYLAQWLDTFVSRTGRWTSPKYLIGESYGTTRVSGLALALQQSHYMYLNGVVLVSPTEIGIRRAGPVQDALYLPYYAATAWHHGMLSSELQGLDLEQGLLPQVERWTIGTLLPALALGSSAGEEKRREVAKAFARYAGLSSAVVLQHNCAVPPQFFWKELLRETGQTVGRLDSRYLGLDSRDAGAQVRLMVGYDWPCGGQVAVRR